MGEQKSRCRTPDVRRERPPCCRRAVFAPYSRLNKNWRECVCAIDTAPAVDDALPG